jgi:diphthamide biosynthesis methyltransferase
LRETIPTARAFAVALAAKGVNLVAHTHAAIRVRLILSLTHMP